MKKTMTVKEAKAVLEEESALFMVVAKLPGITGGGDNVRYKNATAILGRRYGQDAHDNRYSFSKKGATRLAKLFSRIIPDGDGEPLSFEAMPWHYFNKRTGLKKQYDEVFFIEIVDYESKETRIEIVADKVPEINAPADEVFKVWKEARKTGEPQFVWGKDKDNGDPFADEMSF